MCAAVPDPAHGRQASVHGFRTLFRFIMRWFFTRVSDTMLYAIIAHDRADSLETRLATRPEHVARLTRLREEGRLILAGPHPAIDAEDPGPAGFSGSLIVAEFDSLEAAQQWADADPYVAAGVYDKVVVKPFKKVLP